MVGQQELTLGLVPQAYKIGIGIEVLVRVFYVNFGDKKDNVKNPTMAVNIIAGKH